MTAAPTQRTRLVDKHEERRRLLSESALKTLGERGYARTSLRDIAANSQFSHGVVHYYFSSKTELITSCVRAYKETCVTRYDVIVAECRTADELRDAFAAKLAETLVDDAPMHRLWYDLRTQSMFEQDLRPEVAAIDAGLEAMIWRVVSRYAELADRPATIEPGAAYALLDGVFEQALVHHLSGDPDAGAQLTARAARLLPVFLLANA